MITARREAVPIAGYPYSSARIKTEGLHAWQYGCMEARLKLSQGQGLWLAFWMMGDEFREKGWPASDAVDIMENIVSQPDHVYAHMYRPGYSGSAGIGSGLVVPAETRQNNFHIYAIEWDQGGIRWYFDEQK